MTYGTLYGIGVGPGDPELITLKAVNILQRVSVVFAASSTKNTYSLAKNIVSAHLKEGVPVRLLGFPMTRDKDVLKRAWKENADRVLRVIGKEKDAAFVTLGDPMTYSTFGYLMHTIRETAPEIPIEIVPGITSYQAGAAAARMPLAEAEESFTVISGAMGAQQLEKVINCSDRVVMLKVYRHYKEILDTLNLLAKGKRAVLVSRCGLSGQEIAYDLGHRPDKVPHYLSLLIIGKKDREEG